MHSNSSLILLVDDDALTLRSLSLLLSKSGYSVVGAEDAIAAQAVLQEQGFESFGCVLTDFRMPHMTGLQFTDWIRQQDPTLTAILITAEGDKEVIASALRGGVFDYIEKPYRFTNVKDAVDRAFARTLSYRSVASTVAELEQITELQQRLIFAQGNSAVTSDENTSSSYELVTCLHPIKQMGGDFINSYTMPDGRFCVLIGDVSGHDLKAGFVSAYFQGMVRGMLDMKAGIAEVCAKFNNHLIDDWNRPMSGESRKPLKTSLAVCMLVFDFNENRVFVYNHGIPDPLYLNDREKPSILGKANPPLGWFKDIAEESLSYPLDDSGYCYLWSDGLDDCAADFGISSVTLAAQLIQEQDRLSREAIIKTRKDDIILACISWQKQPVNRTQQTLFYEKYTGGTHPKIDAYERIWQNSLSRGIPEINSVRLSEISLCIREAMINALLHGTEGQPDKSAYMTLIYDKPTATLEVFIEDEGKGYEIPSPDSEAVPDTNGHISYGLKIIYAYADCVESRLKGRQLYMRFALER